MTILIKNSIICFSILIAGCVTLGNNSTGKSTWPLPSKPVKKTTVIIAIQDVSQEELKKNDGFYMSNKNAGNLAYNVEELKAYTRKLELLLEKMAKYYNAKLEVEN